MEQDSTPEKSLHPTDSDKQAVFAFFSTLLLSCHFGPEHVEYVLTGNTDMINEISKDVVAGMGKEYSKVMSVLQSRVSDPDGVIKSEADVFVTETSVSGISGVWIVVVDKGWCFLRVGCGSVAVRASGDVREDVVRKVSEVGDRIRDTLLPIQPVE
jgi:hypothetical protein